MSPGSLLQIVLLAAGKGVRMNSHLPKALHRVCGRTMLERAIRACSALDAKRIIVVKGYGAEAVEQEIEKISKYAELSHLHISSVLQEEQCGTGHAAQLALSALSPEEDILILPGDVPLITGSVLGPLVETYRRQSPNLAMLTCVHPEPGSLGRIIRDSDGNIKAIREHRDCSSS